MVHISLADRKAQSRWFALSDPKLFAFKNQWWKIVMCFGLIYRRAHRSQHFVRSPTTAKYWDLRAIKQHNIKRNSFTQIPSLHHGSYFLCRSQSPSWWLALGDPKLFAFKNQWWKIVICFGWIRRRAHRSQHFVHSPISQILGFASYKTTQHKKKLLYTNTITSLWFIFP